MARFRQGPIDWFVIALSPALVIGLIVSFLFFLTGVLYGEGGADAPWNYYLFWYIFGMVLTARISLTQEIANRASLYSLILAGAVWMFLAGLVKVPGLLEIHVSQEFMTLWVARAIAAILLGLGWFLSWKITIDVTDIEENTRVKSGGHFDLAPEAQSQNAPLERYDDSGQKLRKLKKDSRIPKVPVVAFGSEAKSRSPGIWVIGFVLICLPIFAGGQFLVPSSDPERRVYGLVLTGIFFGCALGLLMTTHFLALRLYLGRRGIPMPLGMAMAWLVLGGFFIVGVILASMVLPGPDTPALYSKITASRQAYQAGSKLAQKQGAEGKGDEKVAAKQEVDQKEGKKTVEGKKGADNNKKGDQNSGEKKGDQKSGERNSGNEKKNKDSQPGNKQKEILKENKGQPSEKKGEEPLNEGKNKESNSPKDPSALQKTLGAFTRIIGFLVLIPLALFVLFIFLKLMGIRQGGWFDWLNWLFAWLDPKGKSPTENQDSAEESTESRRLTRRFGELENPFETGEAANMGDNVLVLATTEAVLAWADDLAPPLNQGETFREVVRRLVKKEGLGQELEDLVSYQQSQQYYHLSGKTEACSTTCSKVWKLLEKSQKK